MHKWVESFFNTFKGFPLAKGVPNQRPEAELWPHGDSLRCQVFGGYLGIKLAQVLITILSATAITRRSMG